MNAFPPAPGTGSRLRRRPLLALGAAVAAAVLITGVFAVVNGEKLERIGYFADWNVANRDFTVKELDDSGAPEHLTRLMWAFGDVGPQGLCRIPGNHDQPWELYQRRYDADESVDGRADDYEQELAGSLHQLRLLREKHPHLGASLSLGGWNWSTHFSTAARTEGSREAFAASCLDLWLRGDLPVFEDEPQGGDGVAAGIFDGIDLDWEWPGGGGRSGNVEHPDDAANFTLLVAEFRRQLDALSRETGEDYTLSVSLPGGATASGAYDAEIFDHVDFATVQGYDFAGPWSEETAYHSNLYSPGFDPDADSVDRAVRSYLDMGAPRERLVVGVPAFGRGWQGVDPADDGRGQAADGPADDAYDGPTMAFSDLQEREGRRFLDEEAGAYWVYDGDEWWTYDNPEVIRLKGEYVRERGLGGLMVWSLDMDPEGELVRAMDESLGG
ncbi:MULTISPECIES: glycoside hydrolase family 18 protein [unclassified Nocardiopsis]|uniref:glycoside hydrolase family 18 protein n=1 Tax=unclassified Nocardiopsis TaxID=2649073 RepID=UPI001F5B6AEC|nr:glycoside hydrolase family 18 protein [Nocardiopsis sp. TSRI0078]